MILEINWLIAVSLLQRVTQSGNFSPNHTFRLLKIFKLDPKLLEWYESLLEPTSIINEALDQYHNHHFWLTKSGWSYQIKAQYKLHVTDRNGEEYICDLNFEDFAKAKQFLELFLIQESGGQWTTRYRMVFTNIAGDN